jgi:hypothetical protein
MHSILKSTLNGKTGCSQSYTVAATPDPSPTVPWLFTDPAAWNMYQQHDQLEALKEDITTYVMVDSQWASEDLECYDKIWRLLQEGLLTAKGKFGDLSPHPTVYAARCKGELRVAGHCFHFETGNELIFEPWLARLAQLELYGPVRVGSVRSVTGKLCLSAMLFPKSASTVIRRGRSSDRS